MPRVNGTPDAHCRPARPPRPRSGPDRQVLRAEPVFDTVQRRVRRSLGRLHLQHLAEALDRRGEDQIHIGQNVLVHSAGAIEPRSGQGAGPAQRHRLRAVSDRDQLSVSTAGGEREVHGSRLRADRTVGLFHQRCVGFHPATALGGTRTGATDFSSVNVAPSGFANTVSRSVRSSTTSTRSPDAVAALDSGEADSIAASPTAVGTAVACQVRAGTEPITVAVTASAHTP